MKRRTVTVLACLATLLLLVAYGTGSANGAERPLTFWTIAKSKTWAGTPHPEARFMATIGASELSTGLQLSGFKGSADLNWVKVEPRPEVQRTITLTALKARILDVTQKDDTLMVTVQPERQGYHLVAVDVTHMQPKTLLAVSFKNLSGTHLARTTVGVE